MTLKDLTDDYHSRLLLVPEPDPGRRRVRAVSHLSCSVDRAREVLVETMMVLSSRDGLALTREMAAERANAALTVLVAESLA